MLILLQLSVACNKDPEMVDPGKDEPAESVEAKQAEQAAVLIDAYNKNALIESIEYEDGSYSVVFSIGSSVQISPLDKTSEEYVFVKSIDITDLNVCFYLNDGRNLTLLLKYALGVEFDNDDLGVMGPGESREVHYTIMSNTDNVNVEISPSEGIIGEIISGNSKLNGVIRLSTDGSVTEESYVTILISNEKKIINKKIQFEGAGLKVYDNYSRKIDAKGGIVKLEFLTNVECRVVIPEDYLDWVKESVDTKSMEYDFRYVEVLPNDGGERTAVIRVEGVGKNLSIEYTIVQEVNFDELSRRQREALIALYEATDGENWFINTNWCSDRPIYEWYGVNYNFWNMEPEKTDIVVSLFLDANNLRGKIPEEFACLLDYMSTVDRSFQDHFNFSLNGNGLYGTIPETVMNHPRWAELGWGMVYQNPSYGNILEISEYNLRIKNRFLYEFIDKEPRETDLYDILKRNSYTLVYFIQGAEEGCLTTVDFTKATTNLHLDFHNKGVNTVFSITGLNESIQEWMDISIPENAPEDIIYINNFDPYHPNLGDANLFDSEGNLIYSLLRDISMDQGWFIEQIKNKLISLIGPPEAHPEFEMEDFYTSTDYSKDGEVFILQKATKGNGIDLVFMGDAYVDKDMGEGGRYEQDMKAALEKLFSIEPYQSLRDRFNVYSIKVVSRNNLFFLKDAETRINWDDNVCFEYASAIPGINKDRMMISVIFGSPGFYRNETAMYADGSFISYMSKGITDALIHEIGGHGIPKLFDEYVEPGFETSALDDDGKAFLDQVWKDLEWGANVDWRNDPEQVKWSRFLNDTRYSGENLGIYEGGYLHGYGAYRPTENSMMRYNNFPFNAPSREQIYKTVMSLSEGESWQYNYENFVVFDAINRRNADNSMVDTRGSSACFNEWEKNHSAPVIKQGGWRQATSTLEYRQKISK